MFWPCETRTSTCRSFATISSSLYRFLAIAVLLDVKDIPQVGPLQWGWIIHTDRKRRTDLSYRSHRFGHQHRKWAADVCRAAISEFASDLPRLLFAVAWHSL